MIWPGFYSLESAWLAIFAVPVVIVYFLKLKRPRVEVPSLFLWRKVMEDRRVNSPFQRFKRHQLLFWQLLLLAALVLAAMQPFIPSGAERSTFLPILIDISASMAALDREQGTSRLDVARQTLHRLIDDMLPDQRFSLIAVGNTARRLTDFTDNKRELRAALDALVVQDVASQPAEGFRLAQAMARTAPIETVLFVTDGNLPAEIDFELPFRVQYQRLPQATTNVGITSLSARRDLAEWEIFARIEGARNSNGARLEVWKHSRKEGDPPQLVTTSLISAGTNISQRVALRIDGHTATLIEFRLVPNGFDALTADDVAWIELPVARELMVHCPLQLHAFRDALRGMASVRLFPAETNHGGETADSPVREYDLAITDSPSNSPSATMTLTVDAIPNELQNMLKMTTAAAEVIDWQRKSPLLRHVQLADVQIAEEPQYADKISERDLEKLHYQVLAQSRLGPLILRHERISRIGIHLLFHPDRSTLPYRVGFPIFVSNVVQAASSAAGLSEAQGISTGGLLVKNLKTEQRYQIQAPDGSRQEVTSTTDGQLTGFPASTIGLYRLEERESAVTVPARSLGVSLLSSSETSLAPTNELRFREGLKSEEPAPLKSDRPFWAWIAVLAFVLLVIEWWYFHQPHAR